MGIYAYCLLRLPLQQDWPELRGVGGHPVFPWRSGKYTTLLSHLDRSFPFTALSIVEHGQVIARAFELQTVLPMRFGTFFHSEKQIEELIRENQRELLETFCRLRGKAEMRLKLLFPSTAEKSDTVVKKSPSKLLSLRGRQIQPSQDPVDPASQAIAEQCSEWLRQTFQPLQDHTCCRRSADSELVVDCAHLIESARIENYRRVCSRASDQMKDCALRMSGPWPPYHFLPTAMRLPAPGVHPLRVQPAASAR
ncbi:MAG: GvpL/GvpF family gas vesicle protein [Acidobacteria bacterium]|nr:GvpL/GvpF family gas vesicle protein [Acidobacteriota bacterium]